MSILDLASMVLAPTAVKDGKVYNAIPNDQDFTFSRGTEATRVNSAGLIEKARTNFLTQSNTFDVSASWVNTNTTETGGQTGYDGSSNAWLISKSSSSGFISQNISNSNVQTFSVYAKQGDSDWIGLVFIGGSNPRVYFDLANGTSGSLTGGAIVKDIQSVGNGWYRCSVTCNDTITSVRLYPAEGDGVVSGTSGSIYIQDAQLEQGLVATDLITTTTSSVTVGITDDLPRVDYSGGGCPSLLLEGSRTNLFPQSEYLKDTNHWQVQNVSFSVNQGTSPEGQNNAIKVVPNSTGAAYWFDDTTLTSGQPYVLSFYAKSDGWDYLQVTNSSGVGGSETENFDIINGTSNGDYATGDAVIEEFGNGWYKIIVKGTANASTGRMVIALSSGLTMSRLGSVTPSGSDGVLLYGFQWEQGSYVSSYLPSYGTSTSRSADSCSLTNASNLIGQSEGTFYWEGSFQNSINPILLQLIPSSGNYTNSIYLEYTGGNIRISSWYSGTLQAQISVSASLNTNYKVAFAYKENDFVAYVNGTSIGSDTSGSIPDGLSRVFIGQLNSTTAESFVGCKPKQAILFPTRLTNDQLAELTK